MTVRISRTESFQCYVPLLSTISATGVGVGSVVGVMVRRGWARRRRENVLVGPGQRCLIRVLLRRRVLRRPVAIVQLLPRSQMAVMCGVKDEADAVGTTEEEIEAQEPC